MGEPERTPLVPGRARMWVAVLLAVTALTWLVLGVGWALASPIWWLISLVLTPVFLVVPFSLYWLSEERTGPTWWAFGFAVVLMVTAYPVPSERYMEAAGTPVAATVGDVSCIGWSEDGGCLYTHTLRDPGGDTLRGTLRDTEKYPRGTQLAVLTDPRGVFAPKLATDVAGIGFFEWAALVAFAGFAVATVVAAVQGDRRRRELAAEAHAKRVRDQNRETRPTRPKRRPRGVKRGR